jgi:hypothetical protein
MCVRLARPTKPSETLAANTYKKLSSFRVARIAHGFHGDSRIRRIIGTTMPKEYANACEWSILLTLTHWYCTNGYQSYIKEGDSYIPTEYETQHPNYVRVFSHKVLAKYLGIPHEYLSSSRYPSKEYTMDTTVYLPLVGPTRFTIYPSKQSPHKGLIRFYVKCPFCKKMYPVGRMHQHIRVHKNRGTS